MMWLPYFGQDLDPKKRVVGIHMSDGGMASPSLETQPKTITVWGNFVFMARGLGGG